MAGDNFNWDVVIRLALQGDKQARQGLQDVAGAADELNRQGKVSESTLKSVARASREAGSASRSAAKDNEAFARSANSIRYANYDVASTMFTVSAAIAAAGTATVVAAARQERAFADVQRTAEGSLDGVREAITAMSTEIPVAFTELSRIATLGNQLGVPAAKIEEFTRTVSAFSTITGITADASAQAFGRIGNILDIPIDQFDNLASSMTYTGRTSAATEQQIISLTERLGATAKRAGFTAQEVVGLSGALASVGVAPERAQGVFETYFNSLNEAIAQGGDRLQNFAAITGLTTDALSGMVRAGQGVEVFERFVSNISGMSGDTVAVTAAMESLGLTGLRVNEVLPRIAGNMDLFRKSLQNSTSAWTENTELQAQMAIIMETLTAKWQVFVNALTNMAAAVGTSAAPALKTLLDVATDLLVAFSEFVSSPIGQYLTRLAGGVLLVVGAWAALRGGVALATASFLALQTATRFIGPGMVNGIRQLAIAMGLLARNTQTGATSFVGLGKGFKTFARATGVIAIILTLTQVLTDLGGTVNWVGDAFIWLGGVIGNSLGYVGQAFQIAGRSIKDWGNTLPSAAKEAEGFDAESQALVDSMGDLGGSMGDVDFDDFADGAAGAAAQVRTLTDYANDLRSVWDRAFEIRFSGQTTLDAITTSFNDIRQAAADAAANIRTLKADIGGLQSDLAIQEYFLGIAIEYGDAARAEAIQANIAKLQADLAKKTEELSAEQQKNSRVLTGNSQAALQNRGTIQGLVQQYQAHIGALAASGMGEEELARQTALLQQDFINQATQLGYNTADLMLYSAAFDDVKIAIDNVPRDITVTANMNPAIQALNEFAARASEIAGRAGSDFGSVFDNAMAEKIRTRKGFAKALTDVLDDAARKIGGAGGRGHAGGGGGGGGGGGFSSGGFTGRGSWNQPAGTVHKGEYVVKKAWVDQRTGLPKADALGRLHRGARGRTSYAGGGYVNPGGSGRQTVDISSLSIQQLAQVMDKFVVVNNKVVASATSSSYAADTATGAR